MEKGERYEYCLKNHKPLKFGTTGLRDEDARLTDMQIYLSTRGFLNYLIINDLSTKGSHVALAGDFRPSTPRILFAVAAAIIDCGFFPDYCGKIPTPTIALYGFQNKIPSIMVTASHNPYGQNGVKFMKPSGEVLNEDEKYILDEITKEREIEYKKELSESMFNIDGFFKNFEDLNIIEQYLNYTTKKYLKFINSHAEELYFERYKKTFNKNLDGIRIVFYEQTTVGRDIIPNVLRELGAEVINAGRVDETKEFVPLDTENMKSHILDKMASLAYENNCKICITADGDADRPAVLYLKKDENNKPKFKNGKLDFRFIKGDILNVLVSLLIKPKYVVVPIHLNHKSGFGILNKNNIETILTKIGEPPVIKAMMNILNKENDSVNIYGFEANGGGIILSPINIPGIGIISPLAARDALFPMICVLILMKNKNLDLEDLYDNVFSIGNFSHCHSGLVENLPGVSVTAGLERYNSDIGKKIVQNLKPKNEDIIEIHFDKELIFKDKNGELVVVDDNIIEHITRLNIGLRPYIHDIIEEEVDIRKINFLDGVKVFLSTDDIIHLRPSGNAAQFRIYIESLNEERATALVEKSVKGPNGTLVKFINDFIDGRINI